MTRVIVFAALQWECRPLVRVLRRVRRERRAHATLWHGLADRCEVSVVKTGMGLQRAAAAVRAIDWEPRCDAVVSTGCAGGLIPALQPGALTVASTILGPDGLALETDAALRVRAVSIAHRAKVDCHEGPVLCSPVVLATVAEKRAAAARGAIAVEMESAAIAAHAAQMGVPFVSVRAILDGADTALDHVGPAIDRDTGRLRPVALAAYLATHPGALPGLLGLQRMRHSAEDSLHRFIAAALGRVRG